MKSAYKPLFESFTLPNGVQLANRLVLAPMTHMSSNQDGTVSDAELEYYKRRTGDLGMSITATTFVSANGMGFPGQFAAHDDRFIPGLKRLAEAIKSTGTKAVLQMFHGGRLCPPNAVVNGDVVSASAVPSERKDSATPRALEHDEIEAIIRDFGETTRRAIEAGFDGVEIHGANGYLIQQFFSPHSNRRDDRWGGSLEKRMSFPLAVVDEVKRTVAEHAKEPFIIGYRFSPEEPEEPGITMADTLAFIDVLADTGLDYLHVSLNEFWSVSRRGVNDNRPRLTIIQERVGAKVPIIGVGGIHTPDEAVRALQENGIPLVAIGRELIMEPDWAQKVQEGRENEIAVTIKRDEQKRLAIPDPLWNAIINAPGWFPVEEPAGK